MNTGTFKTSTRYFYAIAFLLIAIVSYSCGDNNGVEGEEPDGSIMRVQMRGANAEALIANASIYMFSRYGTFVEEKLNVERVDNVLTTRVDVDTWDIVLLTCDKDISQNISLPPQTTLMSNAPMWQTKLTPDGNFLSQTPEELMYVMLDDVEIKKDETTQESPLLYRNVAKIQVILNQYEGCDEITPANASKAYAELLDVPTTLAWNGKLFPIDNPTVSQKPIREEFMFDPTGKADTLDFIVPAHRGGDAFKINPTTGVLEQNLAATDTTTHKLKLRVSMPIGNEEYYGRSANGIEIPYVPKINSVLQVKVNFHGKTSLDIKIDVKPWEDWIEQEETFE